MKRFEICSMQSLFMNNGGCLYRANNISNRLNPDSDNYYSVDFATLKFNYFKERLS